MTSKRGPKIEIIPAIDLRNGKCVRLYQGNYSQETIFNENPLEVALRWQKLGAKRLHIVDLDGAAAGDVVNWGPVAQIATGVRIAAQLGGGIRTLTTMERVLKSGIERAILGTIAVENPDLVKRACAKYGDAVIVSIDAREGEVAVRGWKQKTQLKAVPLALEIVRLGVGRFIYTDISQDGTLAGPNVRAIRELVQAVDRPVIAAGGISSVADLKTLKDIGAEGAIIGKALYTGHIGLKEALQAAGT